MADLADETMHRVAVVVFTEVSAVDFTDARFVAETAVRQALISARAPGRTRGYIGAQLRNALTVMVKWSRVAEINTARDMVTITPAVRAYKEQE
jgi:hypothetical protein